MAISNEERRKLVWRKAAASQGASNCVELARLVDGGLAVRNSRQPAGPVLEFTRAEAAAFWDGAKKAEFDDLM